MTTLPHLDLADASLAARLQGRDLAIAAGAGSGKTFSLVALVLGFLGRPEARAHEVVATTFGRESAADLKERILRPLDELAALPEALWQPLLAALRLDFASWDAACAGAGLRGETRVAARQWLDSGAWPAWTHSPAAARLHWIRARREAEGLETATVHGLALQVLQARARGSRDATRELLDAEDPRLVGLLRRLGREGLALPSGHPDHLPARRLLAWLEGRDGDRDRWAATAAAVDAHIDALGSWREDDALEEVRDAFWGQAREGLEAHRPFSIEPSLAAAINKDGSVSKIFEKNGRPKFRTIPGADPSPRELLRFWEVWFQTFPKDGGGLPNYYAPAFSNALDEARTALPALLEFWLGLLMESVLRAFELEKRARGWRSYGDLARDARSALGARPMDPEPKLLLVDEYQDINPVQEAFLQALRPAAIVRVGDRKQAIYGFRGGVAELLDARLREAAARGDAYRLPANHRSTAPIVEVANAFVAEVAPLLDPDSADPYGVQSHGGAGAGQPLVGIVRVDSEKSRGADLPALAPWVAALTEEAGWSALGPSQPAAAPRRRALLLSRRTGLSALRRLLQAQGVEPLVISQQGFWDSPGVRPLMNLLECVARPERPLPILTLLRGPWFGFADPELQAHAGVFVGGWKAVEEAVLPPVCGPAVAWLRKLVRASTQEVIADALSRPGLLESLASLAAHGRLEPQRARRNLERFVGWTLALPAHLPTAWTQLARRRQRPVGDAPPSGDEAGALLIQTIHAAKGLEYEDVILPLLHHPLKGMRKGQLGRRPGSTELSLGWKLGREAGPAFRALEAEESARVRREGLNQLYVGLTRARERMALLQQWPVKDGVPERPATVSLCLAEGKPVFAENVAEELAACLPALPRIETPAPPVLPETSVAPSTVLAPPPERPRVIPAAPEAVDAGRARRQREGTALHALLRECLMRASAGPEAVARHLSGSPLAAEWPAAPARVQAFLDALEVRGWVALPRRTELPLPGGGQDGGMGFADLVVWEPDRSAPTRIHLVDFKLASEPDAARLEAYARQLEGYARILREWHPGAAIQAHLWSLEQGGWIEADGAE